MIKTNLPYEKQVAVLQRYAAIHSFFTTRPRQKTEISFLESGADFLVCANNLTADLESSIYAVREKINITKYNLEILDGSLVFSKVQNLIVDKKNSEVILSGTSGFRALVSKEPVSVTMGRFDVDIGVDNFFRN